MTDANKSMSEADFQTCPSCGRTRLASSLRDGQLLPESLSRAIQQLHPHWTPDQLVCRECVSKGKAAVAQEMIEAEMGEMSPLENEVVDSIRTDTLLSHNADVRYEQTLTMGDRIADRVTNIVGSWWFVSSVLAFLLGWTSVNLMWRPFEPFPVIILAVISAILGSLAAIQGPIILMSQRRQRRWERIQAQNDYLVNLKAELEIQYLDEKIDRFITLQKEKTMGREYLESGEPSNSK